MIHVVTMAFNRPCFTEISVREFQKRSGLSPGDYNYYLLDQHYPLPQKGINQTMNAYIAEEYQINLLSAGKNLGYHEGLNYCVKAAKMQDDDIMIVQDPDALMDTPGWGLAMKTVFDADPSLALVSAVIPHIHDIEFKERGFDERVVAGVRLAYPHKAVLLSVSAWRVKFIKKNGGLKEPRPFYGGIEAQSFGEIKAQDMSWACLMDFHENNHLGQLDDDLFREYKREHGSPDGKFTKGDFDEFLLSKGINPNK